jgi:hypothetical protein
MRRIAAVVTMGLGLIGGVAHAASVEIKDAVTRLVVIPEARSDIKVEMLSTNPSLPLQVRTLGDQVIIDGDLDRRIKNCYAIGGRVRVHVSGIGDVSYDDMPQVVVRVPKDSKVSAGGAVFGSVGKSNSFELESLGCGDWKIANVAKKLTIKVAGSGDIDTGSAGEAVVRVAGSGDVSTGAISGPLTVDVAGSGDVSASSIDGALSVKIAGSGDVDVGGGKSSDVIVSVAGSGNVTFDGVAQNLRARVAGSGDVHVKQVTGEVSKSVVGSGEVTVG